MSREMCARKRTIYGNLREASRSIISAKYAADSRRGQADSHYQYCRLRRPAPCPIMQYSKHSPRCLPYPPMFLMLKMALADASAGKVVKARSTSRVDDLREPVRPPDPTRVMVARSCRGLMADASLCSAATFQTSAAHGAQRISTLPQFVSHPRPIGPAETPCHRDGGIACGFRQNGRCRRCLPPRWGEKRSRYDPWQDAVSRPDTG